jgi:hypothetical protein
MTIKTVADPAVLRSLVYRLNSVAPDSPRRWGTMTAHEMLCHLGDAAEMVLFIRRRREPLPARRRPLMKCVWLWSPVPWPHGVPTNPMHDPKAQGTRPSEFERDRARAIAALERIASAEDGTLEPVHGSFGTMSVRDWQRWAYRHTKHHLRQFGQ